MKGNDMFTQTAYPMTLGTRHARNPSNHCDNPTLPLETQRYLMCIKHHHPQIKVNKRTNPAWIKLEFERITHEAYKFFVNLAKTPTDIADWSRIKLQAIDRVYESYFTKFGIPKPEEDGVTPGFVNFSLEVYRTLKQEYLAFEAAIQNDTRRKGFFFKIRWRWYNKRATDPNLRQDSGVSITTADNTNETDKSTRLSFWNHFCSKIHGKK